MFNIGKKKYFVTLNDFRGKASGIFRIEFRLEDHGSLHRWDITNSGDSSLVFELVAYSIRQALEDDDVHSICFTAKEPSRRKLYSVLAKKLANEIGWELRPDLAKWLNRNNEKPYLIVSHKFAEKVNYCWSKDTTGLRGEELKTSR
jgi:hypothetical protein